MRCRARPFGSKFPSCGPYPSVESEIEGLIRESEQLERELIKTHTNTLRTNRSASGLNRR